MLHQLITGALAICLGWASVSGNAQTSWKPQRNVEIVIGSSAGTGPDRVARIIQRIWREQKMMDAPSSVSNKPGGGGAVAWAYLNQHAGDGHYLLITSYNIVANHITGKSELTWSDFTPISLLITEYNGYYVRPDSALKSVADLVNGLKNDPGAFPIAVSSSAGGSVHIAVGLLLKAGGVDLRKVKVVVFPGANEVVTAVMGGHAGLGGASAGSMAPHFKNGQIRVLAFAAPSRLGGIFATIPTASEAGLRVTANNWRLVMAPKGLTAAQTAYWDDAFRRLATSEIWEKELEANHYSNNYLDSDQTTRYLSQQYGEVKQILTEIGLAKK